MAQHEDRSRRGSGRQAQQGMGEGFQGREDYRGGGSYGDYGGEGDYRGGNQGGSMSRGYPDSPMQSRHGYPDDQIGYYGGQRSGYESGRGRQDQDYGQGSGGYGSNYANQERYGGQFRDGPGQPYEQNYQGGQGQYGSDWFDGGQSRGSRPGWGSQDNQGWGRSGVPSYHGRSARNEGHFDSDYSQWRDEQMRALDEDYHSWRDDRYKKFSDEFSQWRNQRTNGGKGTSSTSTSQTGTSGSGGKDNS